MSTVIPPMSGHWIKLHTEILNNRVYSTLPQNLFELAIKLKLVMGMTPKDHVLPPLEDIGFKIRRTDTDVLLKEMEELQRRGILDHDGKNWILPNIVEEGAADSPKVRQARHRENERLSRSGNDHVTNRDPERQEIERSEQDKTRAEEDTESVSAASADLFGDLAKSLTASLDGGSPNFPDDAFWERQQLLRPDLHMEKVREKLEIYCRKNRKKLTREYAEAWVKREKTPLEEITPFKPKKPKIDVAFEEEAFKWRSVHYPDSIDPARHPTWKTLPFKDWPTETQKEFLSRENQA